MGKHNAATGELAEETRAGAAAEWEGASDEDVAAPPEVGAAPPAKRRGLIQRLLGPRLIDLPIRILVLIVVVSGLMPRAFESHDPLYVACTVVGLVMLMTATYAPVWTAAAAAVLFVFYTLVLPEYLNPFQNPMVYAAAVLLTRFKWVRSLIVTAAAIGLNLLAHALAPESATPVEYVIQIWIALSVLALALGLFELRIRREIDLRERAAREHERRLQNERIGFAIDTHDTVSHGLATQGALIRLLARERDERERHRLLGEFAMVNGDTQLQLRALLARLSDAQEGREPALRVPERELQQTAGNLLSAAEVGGIRLGIDLELAGASMDAAALDGAKLIMRELVTNIVKHSAGSGECTLRGAVEGSTLRLESSNPSDGGQPEIPRSLAARAESLGGTCVADGDGGVYRVTVRVPLSVGDASD